jgi:hypothetical protein
MVGYCGYLFLTTVIDYYTWLFYGWFWLKLVEIIFLSFMACYTLLEAVNLLYLVPSYDPLNHHIPTGESHAPQ